MSTRISLRTGGAIVVPETIDEVRRLLEDGQPHVFVPEHHRTARGENVAPEPLAVRINHVAMLADAGGEDAGGSAQLESGRGRTFTDLFRDSDDYERWERESYGRP